MEHEPSIFLELKTATQVGGLQTSMQGPDVDNDVLSLAITGQADPAQTVLWLHSGDEPPVGFTVTQLQEARRTSRGAWELPGETLWID
jgi:hypothetical protein